MTRFNRWLKSFKPQVWDAYAAYNKLSFLQPVGTDAGKIQLIWPNDPNAGKEHCPKSVDPRNWHASIDMIRALIDAGSVDALLLWPVAGLCSGGVKCYAPDADTYRALGNTAVSIPIGEYRQPFDTFCIIHPDECSPKLSDDFGCPLVSIVRYDHTRRVIVLVIFGDGSTAATDRQMINLNLFLSWTDETAHVTLEDRIGPYDNSTGINRGSEYVPMNPAEVAWMDHAKRVAFNACMVLVKSPHIARPANHEYAARLERSLGKKGIPENIRDANRRELSQIPTVYTIDRTVRLYTRGSNDESTPAGYRTAPHWRRGHWAKYHVGAGRSRTEYRLRPAVLVNADLFGGDMGQTRTVYKG